MVTGALTTNRFLSCSKGFTLIEMAVTLAIIAVLVSIAASLLWNTESADAAMVRSVQEQLQSGASQAAMLTGDLPNDDANLVTLATYISDQLDVQANVALDCDDGAGVCHMTVNSKRADFLVGINGLVQITALTGFSSYTIAGGQIIAI